MLRIAGIALFAFTLGKIFLFDLVSLSVINRTMLFIAIGALMLVTSYLYQRFKDVIEQYLKLELLGVISGIRQL